MNGIGERSYEPITPADLDRLAALAAADREARFTRRPRWSVSGDRIICVALHDWRRTMSAARFLGWSAACAASGCAGSPRAPLRVVLYNGYPGHGDPAHCAPPGCQPHLHLSWSHAPTAPLTPAPWVDVLGAGS